MHVLFEQPNPFHDEVTHDQWPDQLKEAVVYPTQGLEEGLQQLALDRVADALVLSSLPISSLKTRLMACPQSRALLDLTLWYSRSTSLYSPTLKAWPVVPAKLEKGGVERLKVLECFVSSTSDNNCEAALYRGCKKWPWWNRMGRPPMNTP
ncbi:MAG: hypothetical protein R2857_09215 [Vampirovibrionales bacterium]